MAIRDKTQTKQSAQSYIKTAQLKVISRISNACHIFNNQSNKSILVDIPNTKGFFVIGLILNTKHNTYTLYKNL